MTLTHMIATFGGTGHMRPMSGTWGSAAGLVAAWLLYVLGGVWLVVVLIPLAYVAGVWATRAEIAQGGNHDPSHVVIDEVVGQWIALLPVLAGAAHAGVPALALWPGWITAFIAFRAFDILKPGPVGWADRRADATGVMLDDVIAGVFAALTVAVLGGVSHALM